MPSVGRSLDVRWDVHPRAGEGLFEERKEVDLETGFVAIWIYVNGIVVDVRLGWTWDKGPGSEPPFPE
jgi:hypothetical protein